MGASDNSNLCADDLMVMNISFGIPAFRIEDGKEQEIVEELSMNLGCGADDAEDTAVLLRSIAAAVEEGRVYGWMRQHCFELELGAGEIRPMTLEEQASRSWRE